MLVMAAIMVGLTTLSAAAQGFSFSSFTIEGNQRVADSTILSFAGLAPGAALDVAGLNDAGQDIRETGLFESVELIPQGNGLLIRVVEYPTINRINIEGNSRISDAELLPVIQSAPRRVFTPAQAEADTAAIAGLYAREGRINARVTPRIIPRTDNRVDLVFEVVESAVTEIGRISFVGNRTFSENRLRRVLETKEAGVFRAIVGRDTFSPERVAEDRRVLTDFYRSRGFIDFVIQNIDVTLTAERDAYLVTFTIQEGQRFTIADVSLASEIAGVDAQDFQGIVRLQQGDTYSPVPVASDLERLERAAVDQGLRFVRAEPRITRNPRDLSLNVQYVLTSAPRIFVERIDIEGNSTTLDRVIRGQFRTVEGDPLNPREIEESARRIRGLGFFRDVAVNTRPGSTDSQRVIEVDITEGPTGSLTFGANFNSDTGASLIASYRQSNFQGRGQRLSFDLSTAETNRRFAFGFTEPQLLGRDLRGSFDVTYLTTDNENALYDTETFRLSPKLSFPISEEARLQLFYALDYSEIADVSGGASTVIIAEAAEGGLWTNSLGYTLSYDSRRNGIDPNTGIVLRFGQEFGFGDTQFVKTTALAGAETRVLNEEVTLRATLEGGLLTYNEGSSRVTDRFFLGSRLMRGFEPGGIGPRDDATDDALGGNAFSVLRLEAEFPLGLPSEYNISGGAFIDYGSVWDVGNTQGAAVIYDDFTARAIAGVSLFWTTPIGPLRFNFTEPLDVQPRDETRNFEITISTSF